jgi:iron complex outermembrane recepter protein
LAFNDRNSKYTLVDVAAKLDGPVMDLPAGKMRAAIGAQYHTDKLPYFLIVNNTTPNTSITRTTDNSANNPERDVTAVFAQLDVPLVSPAQKIGAIEQLDVSLAVRSERYSDFGSTSNPKVGLSWVPVQGLEVRSTYSKAFRAPTLGDTDSVNGSVVSVVDLPDADGRTSLHGIRYLGGNPNGLKPETATIKTIGLGFKPKALEGLSASLDYYSIDYRNRILTPGNDPTVLQKPELAPYVNRAPTVAEIQAAIANPVYSGNLTEPVAGIRYIIDGRRQNAGVVQISGVDFAAKYAFNAVGGQASAGFTGTYVSRYRQQFTPTTPLVDGLLNTLNNPLRLRVRGELAYARAGVFNINAFINHTNAYRNTTLATAPVVSADTTLDLNARWEIGRHFGIAGAKELSLALTVQNVADKSPPYVQNGTLAFDPQNVSAIGRFVAVSLNNRW